MSSSVNINFLAVKDLPSMLLSQLDHMQHPRVARDAFLCLAMLGDHILGFCSLRIMHHFANIESLCIREAHSTTKLDKVLLSHSLRQLQKMEVNEVNALIPTAQLKIFLNAGFIEETITLPNVSYAKQEQSIEVIYPNLQQANFYNVNDDTKQNSEKADTSIHYGDRETYNDLYHMLLASAKRRIWLLAENMNDPVLTNRENTQLIQKLAKNGGKAEIRVLLEDDRQPAKGHFPILQIAQNLSSFVEVRTLKGTRLTASEWVCLCDYRSSAVRKVERGYTGTVYLDNPLVAERLRHQYNQLWQHSKLSSEVRRLVI